MSISLQRAKVLSIIAHYEKKHNKPISITEISKQSGIPKGTTLMRYIDELKDRKLITISERDKKIQGYPVFISTTKKADPVALQFWEWMEKAKDVLFDDDKETKTT